MELEKRIFAIENNTHFEEVALEVFRFQSANCEVYKAYMQGLNVNPSAISSVDDIPFLPIEFFKTHSVITSGMEPELIFESSGTTGMQTSKHSVANTELYKKSFLHSFNKFIGNPHDYCILALLPSYLERENSSLVYMTQELILQSKNEHSGFYLNNEKELSEKLILLEKQKQKTLLIGVSFALLDFSEKYPQQLKHTIVMETGGMKGRKKEILREELHQVLCKNLGVKNIFSEYGMTELLSQAYSSENGIFRTPPWMKVYIRDVNDAFEKIENGKTGGINITDLANFYSCSFISTQDVGKKYNDESFEVLGRFDFSDLRGCNLLTNSF